MGQPLIIKTGPWSEMRAALTRGEIDVLPGMLYSEERDVEFDFTASHLDVSYSIFVRKDTPAIATEDDLRDKEVIVETGSLMHDHMRRLSIAGKLIEVTSEPEALRLLSTGSHDCALVPYQAGLLILRREELSNVEPSGSPVYDVDLCMAVREGNVALRERLDEALAQVRRSDEYRRIYNRWFGTLYSNGIAVRDVLRAIAGILGLAAFIVVIALAWSISLRRKVAQRTQELTEENRKRQLLEQQLYHSQKMEAIGQLAGGIAHDFNNLLASIIGYTDLLIEEVRDGDPKQADLLEVRRAGELAAHLTQQLLTFSRRELPRFRIINLNEVIGRHQSMVRHATGERYDLVIDLDPSLRNIQGDPSQIEQVLLNLVLNARDAMPDGGTLTIRTSNSPSLVATNDDAESSLRGREVVLEVVDNGVGMDEETRVRAFEPFFTTKESGKGTGLGLAVVYGIVQQHGATIAIDSGPGVGTRFQIRFPVSQESQTTEDTHVRNSLPGGENETILVVEDDNSVRDLACRILRQNGYTVRVAANAEDALAAVSDDAAPIDLVITDVVLPGTDGPKVARRIQELRPQTSVIFMSGYAHTVLSEHGSDCHDIEFIQKPFTAAELLVAVRRALDENRPAS
jgi:signal transduction histidine kinase/CheY-like chemotaxis protein